MYNAGVKKYPRRQSSWGRATSDTRSVITSPWFWGAEVFVSVPLGGILTGLLTSNTGWGAVGSAVSALALLVLAFLYNLIRAPFRQRDEARAAAAARDGSPSSPKLATPQLFIRSDGHQFGKPGQQGYPQPNSDATRLLRIDLVLTPTNGLQVESVELEVQGKRIPSTWESNEVSSVPSGQYIYFEVPPDVTPGDHQVTLVALADGTRWLSPHFSLTFPAASND